MNLIDQVLEGLVCLKGEEGKDFIYYKTVEELYKRMEVDCPYRNLN